LGEERVKQSISRRAKKINMKGLLREIRSIDPQLMKYANDTFPVARLSRIVMWFAGSSSSSLATVIILGAASIEKVFEVFLYFA
jgi:Asp/Glu/hydantoin racemase